MPITRMFTMECDSCNEEYDSDMWLGHMKERARADGWSIGKRVTCPDCRDG